MNKFVLHKTPIDDLEIIVRSPILDHRGFFERMYCHETLSQLVKGKSIRQINRTFTKKKGTVRGLHFQYPKYAETKIISCLRGEIWDIAVDLRRDSPTFLQHYSVLLTQENRKSFIIPEGFAHGFQTLASGCEILYFHTADFNAETEGGINALDPRLAISWPKPILSRSERDIQHAMLKDGFQGIDLT